MGTTIAEDLLQLKRKIELAKTEKAQLEGRKQEAEARLLGEFGCKTIAEAKTLQLKLQNELAGLDSEIETGVAALTKKLAG